MKCQVTSSTTHDVLISKEISYKSYKEICSGEKKKVNLGYNNVDNMLKVENNSLVPIPKTLKDYIHGIYASMASEWEVLSKFFSIHTLNPTGWTVTAPMVGMTRTWEGGLAVWERFEELNIECDD